MIEKNFLIQLTTNLYQLTLLFPKKEPLRYKMREVADEILTSFLKKKISQNPVLEDLEILDSFFEIAKDQNWVAQDKILTLQKAYRILKSKAEESIRESLQLEVKKATLPANSVILPPDSSSKKEEPSFRLNPRQEKIIEFLKENEKAQVWQIKQIFPNVSKRTLRRDFKFLLKQGIIERIGERNDTFYALKR